jgi:hypothetical protein
MGHRTGTAKRLRDIGELLANELDHVEWQIASIPQLRAAVLFLASERKQAHLYLYRPRKGGLKGGTKPAIAEKSNKINII